MTLCHWSDFICFSFCQLYLPSFLGLWIDFGNLEMFLPHSLSNTCATMFSNSDFSCQSSILLPSLQMASSTIPLSPGVIPSKNSNAIPVSDETEAYNLLNTFPNHYTGDCNLLLKCPPNIVTHPSIAHTIKSLRAQNRKITFDPESEILKVQVMPQPPPQWCHIWTEGPISCGSEPSYSHTYWTKMRHYRIQRPSTVKVKDKARCRQKKKKKKNAVVVQVTRRNYTLQSIGPSIIPSDCFWSGIIGIIFRPSQWCPPMAFEE